MSIAFLLVPQQQVPHFPEGQLPPQLSAKARVKTKRAKRRIFDILYQQNYKNDFSQLEIIFIYLQKQMTKRLGIEGHLELFYKSIESKRQKPCESIISNLKELQGIGNQRKGHLIKLKGDREQIDNSITKEEIQKLFRLKNRKAMNEKVLKVLKIKQKISEYVQQFKMCEDIEDFMEKLNKKNKIFKEIQALLTTFSEELYVILIEEEKGKIVTIQFFKEIRKEFTKKIANFDKKDKIKASLKQFFEELNLPLKKGKKLEKSDLKSESLKWIGEQLFNEYCYFCLCKKIEMLIEDEEKQKIESIFFETYWYKVQKSIIYIFLNPENKKNQASAYQIDEPNWLFQYMEETFNLNFQCLQYLMTETLMSENIWSAIKIYILHYNFEEYFLANIKKRLQTDLQEIKNMEKEAQKKYNFKFIVFNFFDELYSFQQKLSLKHHMELNMVEEVLLKYNNNSLFDFRLLDYNFDHEHEWIENQIFSDFYNIDYSKIGNLKNVEAFNITINYIQLFDKLYSKFQKIKDEKLKYNINLFYQESILQFVRHLKTSFQRIYNNSGLNKYQIILSFKRVQQEFKSYFYGFIQSSPSFEQKIKEQYFSSLIQITNIYALEQLNVYHKKIIQKLTSVHDYFEKASEGSDVEGFKSKMKEIFNNWVEKIQKINKIHVYGDPKIKNIFFTYLETTSFVFEGYELFISAFQPFLKQIYTLEGMRMVRMFIQMDKGTFKEYISSHQQVVSFLTNSELKSIQKSKIK